ncbi:hypothetical protein C0993_006729 [Termitomyces sp. T159_Od127]|nr:hypothetical protein C0993_006729 [Termitomyces sp. T159_Od127]
MEPPNRPKSGVARRAAKRPLQDVTDRYYPTRSPENRPSPNINPRRKPNPLRTAAEHVVVSTSLPPSSPPSASSRPVAAHARHVSPLIPSHSLEYDGRLDTTTASDADPFGFFALENKLKIFRSRQQHAKPRKQPTPSPQIQAVHPNSVNPLTQHQGIRSPSSPFSKDDSEPTASVPSTPLNAVSKKGKERAVAEERSTPRAELAVNNSETPVPSQKAKLRRRNAKGVPDVPSRESPPRRQAYTTKLRKNVSHRRTHGEGGRASPAESLTKTTRQKSRVKRIANPVSGVDTDDAKERQARLDYFKRLEGYQLEKENVYVI